MVATCPSQCRWCVWNSLKVIFSQVFHYWLCRHCSSFAGWYLPLQDSVVSYLVSRACRYKLRTNAMRAVFCPLSDIQNSCLLWDALCYYPCHLDKSLSVWVSLVFRNSAGHVYLRFETIAAAMSAQRALHGRWFAGKMITTTYMTAPAYENKFPESKLAT